MRPALRTSRRSERAVTPRHRDAERRSAPAAARGQDQLATRSPGATRPLPVATRSARGRARRCGGTAAAAVGGRASARAVHRARRRRELRALMMRGSRPASQAAMTTAIAAARSSQLLVPRAHDRARAIRSPRRARASSTWTPRSGRGQARAVRRGALVRRRQEHRPRAARPHVGRRRASRLRRRRQPQTSASPSASAATIAGDCMSQRRAISAIPVPRHAVSSVDG